MANFFQNKEFIVPYAHVTHVVKYPPDRLEVGLNGGAAMTIITTEDCSQFLKGYAAFLSQQS